jgi:hypothetical protein
LGKAQDAFYKGKTVRVIVGFPAGGGSDAEGRVLARHIGKYVPGNPTLILQNMPGAGGLTASNYWFEDLAKPDGLTLYYCVGSTAVTQQAFGLEGVKYDLRSWEMLGSVNRATSVVLLRPDKVERLTAKDQPPLGIGARTGDDAWSTIFLWGAEYLNWNVRWILGYQGGGELRLAFEAWRDRPLCDGQLAYLARADSRRFPSAHATGLPDLIGFVPEKARVQRCPDIR